METIGFCFALFLIETMLSRRDILIELKRMGVTKPSLLKDYLRDFERYIGTYYDFRISKDKKRLNRQPDQDTESPSERVNVSALTQKAGYRTKV